MSSFGNDAINRVYLHSAVMALAYGAGTVFILVYLLRAGVPVPIALLAQAGIVAGRFLLRPLVLPLAVRFGIKPVLVAGGLGMSGQYFLLAGVNGVGWGLLALCIASSVGEVFYYVAYNAYVASRGDAEHRGKQVSAREAVVALVGIVAPPLGAWSIAAFGPHAAFAAVGLVQILSVLPLLGAPNVPVKAQAPGAFKAARVGALLIGVDGWFDAFYFFVWQIALFVSLGRNLAAYGGAMALAGLVGAGFGLVLGRVVDAGKGRRAVGIAYGAAAVIVVLRAASLDQSWLAVSANALGALLMPLLVPPLVTATYNLAKASPCVFRFQMGTEGGWDVGCFFACLLAAGLTSAGISLGWVILLALPGVVGGAVLLWRQFPPSTA